MDLLSLTFRSLELGDAKRKTERNVETPGGRARKLKVERTDSCEILETIGLSEVAWHDTSDNCWIVIYDYVYDCTDFLSSHPGGLDMLLEYAGRDATLAFIGTGHSKIAVQSLKRYLIGELPAEERIFRVPDGVKVTGF